MFEPLAPYVRTSVTSLEAAESIEPRTSVLQRSVLHFLKRRGALGATDEEIQHALAMNPSTERPRRIELLHKGLIVEADATRKTTSGRRAAVWIAL
jgi:hypothetical protein